ncbi:MAG: hypothetical protein UDK36_05285 [Bacteroidaceae bacterium]|nr:hypothetical protein [Bacteroidaceae bacterium]
MRIAEIVWDKSKQLQDSVKYLKKTEDTNRIHHLFRRQYDIIPMPQTAKVIRQAQHHKDACPAILNGSRQIKVRRGYTEYTDSEDDECRYV